MAEQNGICAHSGFKFPMSQLVRQWDGALVHSRYADKRNPADFPVTVREHRPARVAPEAADVFLSTNEVQAEDL